jgi:hypothetical protein
MDLTFIKEVSSLAMKSELLISKELMSKPAAELTATTLLKLDGSRSSNLLE